MKKTISFTIEENIVAELKQISRDEQINMSATAQMLFEKWLEDRDDRD